MNFTKPILAISLVVNVALAGFMFNQGQTIPTDAEDIRGTMTGEHDNSALDESNHSDKIESGPVVATVNDIEIHQFDLLPYVNEIIPDEQKQTLKHFGEIGREQIDTAVKNFAVDVLVEKLANESNITDNPRLKATLDQNRRRYIRAAYMTTLASQLVDDDQIKQRYTELVNSLHGKQEYKARHILLASRKEADIIFKALQQKKKTFSELAKLFSLDDATSYNGGDLGYHLVGSLDPQFETGISSLEPGAYSEPFETELGWHIAIVDDRRASTPVALEQAAPAIRKSLQQLAADAYARELIAGADIHIIDTANNYDSREE